MNNLSYLEKMQIIENHQKHIPVNVEAIAAEFGIKVYKESDWPDDLCGKIIKDKELGGNSEYAIFINGRHSEGRQRFTLAHEIAHFVLHQENIGDGITDDALYRSRLSNSQEVMANKFAADILMPFPLLNLKIQEGINTVEKLAALFQVSPSAMAIRLGIPSN